MAFSSFDYVLYVAAEVNSWPLHDIVLPSCWSSWSLVGGWCSRWVQREAVRFWSSTTARPMEPSSRRPSWGWCTCRSQTSNTSGLGSFHRHHAHTVVCLLTTVATSPTLCPLFATGSCQGKLWHLSPFVCLAWIGPFIHSQNTSEPHATHWNACAFLCNVKPT